MNNIYHISGTHNKNTIYKIMNDIRYHLPWLIIGILFWILVVVSIITGYVYLSWLGDKIDRMYSVLDVNSICEDITN